jgi:hypothetical protein
MQQAGRVTQGTVEPTQAATDAQKAHEQALKDARQAVESLFPRFEQHRAH